MESNSQNATLEFWKPPLEKCSVVSKRTKIRQRLVKASSVHSLNKASSSQLILCRPLFFRTPPSSAKRSVSLQDLSPARLIGRKMFSNENLHQEGDTAESLQREMSTSTKLNVMRAYSRFLHNAWRSCRSLVARKNEALALQLSQIKNLQMQSSSMKSLLEADVEMISDYCKEIRALTQKVQELETEKSHYEADHEEICLLKKEVENYSELYAVFLEKSAQDVRRLETKLEDAENKSNELKNILTQVKEKNKKLAEEKEVLTKNLEMSVSKIVYLEERLNSKVMKIVELNSHVDTKCKNQWTYGILRKINAFLVVPITVMKLINGSSFYD